MRFVLCLALSIFASDLSFLCLNCVLSVLCLFTHAVLCPLLGDCLRNKMPLDCLCLKMTKNKPGTSAYLQIIVLTKAERPTEKLPVVG